MDAFYASVELLRYPELRGLPVVVGGGSRHPPALQPDGTWRFARLADYAGRGVITTATYEARALGVHSGLGLMKAAALAPDAALLPTDFDRYRKFSRLFKAAVAEVAPMIEDRGIDEIYIDLTPVAGSQDETDADPYAGVRALASAIKARVKAATGLSCSMGITPNKLLSKICSDLEKPDGLTILTAADIPVRIWPLPAKRINGIGPKANEKLAAMGILSIGDLAAADPQALIARFGPNYGAWLREAAQGRDERPVVTYSEPKSLSRETTFERDLHPRGDRAALGGIFTQLCERVAEDLRRKGYVGRTVGVKLRYDDFRIATRELTLPQPTDDAQAIRHAAGLCLKRLSLDRKLRLLGVRVGTLCRPVTAVAEPAAAYASPADDATLPLF
ncbi:MAG: DNA polymerase IV [Rhodocyclales bacterium]|nr:DNA polymerase IV [Rhodocyclales bacterium]MBI5786579.1 DNA polymerase IV [Rhodocyclales bacterium]